MNLSIETPLNILFEEAYDRSRSLDDYKCGVIHSYLDYLKEQYMGGPHEDKLALTLTGVHNTITKHIASDMSMNLYIPKSDLKQAYEEIEPENYCKEIWEAHDNSDVAYPKVTEYELYEGPNLYTELTRAFADIASMYEEDPVVMSRMYKYLEKLLLKESKRLSGEEIHHYSLEDNWGYNHIALQIDAVLKAAKALSGLGKPVE